MDPLKTKKTGKTAQKTFRERLLHWNTRENNRQMPWKGEKDPYRIWLSEIILQQTRVDQGLKYYNSFITEFPSIKYLAEAPDDRVFKLWEGLGYYSRCRNLVVTARYIATEKKGIFPGTYEEIKSLKGIGPYTAAAISSFAFNLPYAVVDGNVFRVLSRVFGVDTPIDSTEGKKTFTQLADELLDKQKPGIYNQAIMDFGAVVCKPANPLCGNCPLQKQCVAFLENRINALPVKEKKITIKKRWFYYFILEYKEQVAIRQRTAKDIWQQLFEFPMIETGNETDIGEITRLAENRKWLSTSKYTAAAPSPLFRQQLSHQLIAARFIAIKLKVKPSAEAWLWIDRADLPRYAFPQILNQYINKAKEPTLF